MSSSRSFPLPIGEIHPNESAASEEDIVAAELQEKDVCRDRVASLKQV